MTPNTAPQILLTGATGFVGGTILTHLLSSSSPALNQTVITCLVRGADRAAVLSSKYGNRVRPVIYKDLDDLEATTAAAAQSDIVINTTLGYHVASGQALLRGLAQRKASTGGRDVWMIHTSGTSNVADQPITKAWVEKDPEREFDDARDDIYGYEKEREALRPYAQRTAELAVVDTGLDLGVKTLVIMSPTIYGIGTGLFNKTSVQVPAYILSVLDHGRSVVVEGGKGVWDHVHVEDLAELYEVAVVDILDHGGASLPSGKKGIIFSGNGRHSWMEAAQGAADACYEEGKLADKRVQSIGLAEGASILNFGKEMLELGLSSNSRTVSSVGRQLGWKPTRGEEAWIQGFRDDLKAVLAKRK
ncbi:Uu.00g047420.m01.CDS01 [Anthostomella pinea]|uniref:Uu.00g047420.m01.CDS01 n=1 Tax=Anthostomella pinea TaxID=933095 RepID=A0AAI8VBJ1_9PEZI|nr:Uu.00g047420.m01.CDS01 [Anthostomella pinea]